jgi:uncharacterized membrane protein YkgB
MQRNRNCKSFLVPVINAYVLSRLKLSSVKTEMSNSISSFVFTFFFLEHLVTIPRLKMQASQGIPVLRAVGIIISDCGVLKHDQC